MKIMQILENRKIEKKLRKEIMPSAWETIEDMTGRTIIDKSSLSVKIEDMDHYIQGKCSGNKSIILNTVHAYSAYHSSKKELRFSDAALGIESLLRNSNGTAQSEQIKT